MLIRKANQVDVLQDQSCSLDPISSVKTNQSAEHSLALIEQPDGDHNLSSSRQLLCHSPSKLLPLSHKPIHLINSDTEKHIFSAPSSPFPRPKVKPTHLRSTSLSDVSDFPFCYPPDSDFISEMDITNQTVASIIDSSKLTSTSSKKSMFTEGSNDGILPSVDQPLSLSLPEEASGLSITDETHPNMSIFNVLASSSALVEAVVDLGDDSDISPVKSSLEGLASLDRILKNCQRRSEQTMQSIQSNLEPH